jgi:hypothetical protein
VRRQEIVIEIETERYDPITQLRREFCAPESEREEKQKEPDTHRQSFTGRQTETAIERLTEGSGCAEGVPVIPVGSPP